MSMTPDERSEFLQIFLDETEEELDTLVETLLVLEDDPGNKDHLNEAFRMVHSIKGAAGMMGFDEITSLTHQLESRFEKLRSGIAVLDAPTMTVSLKCVDYLRACNGKIRAGEALLNPSALLHELTATEPGSKLTATEPGSKSTASVSTASDHATASTSSDNDSRESDARFETTPSNRSDQDLQSTPGENGSPRYRVRIVFEPGLKLLDMKGQLVTTRLADEGDILSTEPTIEELASLTGPVKFIVTISSDRTKEQIGDAADVHGVQSVDVLPEGDEDVTAPTQDLVASSETKSRDSKSESPESIAKGQSVGQIQDEQSAEADATDASKPKSSKGKVAETVRVEIDRLDNLLNLAGELVVSKARFTQLSSQMSPAFKRSGGTSRAKSFGENLRRAIERMRNAPETDRGNGWAQLLSELEDELAEFEQQIEDWESGRRCFGEINEAIDQLSRVSENLQRGVLQTRMVPVAPLFNRFKRVVRDLSSDRGKKVRLQIAGEKTELDKRMIDELGDPLVHLVRNSIDHGMETPDQRSATGKPETGSVTLEASHSGNNVFIVVRDDGRGICADKVRARIVDRGLLSAADADELSDQQVIEYIWHPGFSTASEVTNISGRGVGMDIVKTRIAELNGTVDVETTAGKGTTFRIRLPLTLAIINGLLFRIGYVNYSVPIDDVREIVSVPPERIIAVHGKETLDVRGEFISVVSIDELFSWHSVPYKYRNYDPTDDPNVSVLVLQSAGRAIGLKVDELLGGEDIVIKSLSENFVNIRGLSGASILGDGTVSLLLDAGTMINMLLTNQKES